MFSAVLSCALATLAQPDAPSQELRSPATWTDFYQNAAKEYQVKQNGDRSAVHFRDQAVFDWASIDDYHGAVFAWTDRGRPTMVATIFSFPLKGSPQRLAVHEFASFAEAQLSVSGPGDIQWSPPLLTNLQRLPGADPPASRANQLKLQCRRLAKDFSATLNRRGERWELRLLTTPLVEYQDPTEDILGGGLFGFVAYSTDPEILLLLEARKSATGPAWHYKPVRFSDKSLYLKYKDQPVWESLRAAHGGNGPDTEDPLYRVLTSQRLAPDLVEKLSAKDKRQP